MGKIQSFPQLLFSRSGRFTLLCRPYSACRQGSGRTFFQSILSLTSCPSQDNFYFYKFCGEVAQLGEHRIRIAGVGSSNLLFSTKSMYSKVQ